MKVEKHMDDIIQDIVDVLMESDGKYVADISNKILAAKVTYRENDWFEVEYERE